MYVLGISCFYHDSAAALVHDGLVVAAAEEERFSRIKHDSGFPSRAVEFCLRRAGITAQDLDHVVFYEKPLVKFERILLTSLQTYPRSWRTFGESMITWLDEKLWVKSIIAKQLDLPLDKVLFTEHHMAHAASSFFCSPFDEAAVLTVDGVGEWTTTALGTATSRWAADSGRGNGSAGDGSAEDGSGGDAGAGDRAGAAENRISLDEQIHFPHSLGLLYSAFTAFLGFEVNEGEYKVMGMAPYGEPRYQDRIYKLLHVEADGSFALDMSYFSFHHSPERTYSRKFVELFGPPRDPRMEFKTERTHPGASSNGSRAAAERNQYYADVAASIQRVTEDVLLRIATHLHRKTGLTKLCLAGGVALNSVANGRILRETPFEEIFIHPAAGDSGGAVGAALYVYHVVLGHPRRFVMENAYLGDEHTEADVRSFLDAQGVRYEAYDDEDRLVDRLVDDLTSGRVIAMSQGRFEWGPRALGNRSIIADPRTEAMRTSSTPRSSSASPSGRSRRSSRSRTRRGSSTGWWRRSGSIPRATC